MLPTLTAKPQESTIKTLWIYGPQASSPESFINKNTIFFYLKSSFWVSADTMTQGDSEVATNEVTETGDSDRVVVYNISRQIDEVDMDQQKDLNKIDGESDAFL